MSQNQHKHSLTFNSIYDICNCITYQRDRQQDRLMWESHRMNTVKTHSRIQKWKASPQSPPYIDTLTHTDTLTKLLCILYLCRTEIVYYGSIGIISIDLERRVGINWDWSFCLLGAFKQIQMIVQSLPKETRLINRVRFSINLQLVT